MTHNPRSIGRGYLMAVVSAVTYGLNPLFGKPLSLMGMDVPSMLFYRYVIAAIILAMLMVGRGDDFRLSRKEIPAALIAGVLFAVSSICLFQSFTLMDVGIASAILFVYPVFVTIIMVVMYGERLSAVTVGAIALALVGIVCMATGEGDGSGRVNLTGILCVLASAIAYAVYIVAVNKSRLRHLSAIKLTFYSMVFGLLAFAISLDGFTTLQWVPARVDAWGCVIGLAIFPTIISLLTMTVAIHDVGSIPTSILGALEPVTALAVGIWVFGETLTAQAALGVIMVVVAVAAIVLRKPRRE